MAEPSNANESEIANLLPASKPPMTTMRSVGFSLGDARRRRTVAAIFLVLSLVALTGVASLVRRSAIETELRTSVSNAISIEHPGLAVSVVGRDVTIRGQNLDSAAKKNLLAVARKRRGVRTVRFAENGVGSASEAATSASTGPGSTGATAGDPSVAGADGPGSSTAVVRPPKVTAVYDATTVTVSGEVPSAESKDALLGRLKKLSNGVTLRDAVSISASPTETPDLPQYRRLGTFFETMARLPVRSAELTFDRTILTLKAEVADDARRELLRRESVVLVGGKADQVRGQIVLTVARTNADAPTTTGETGATSSTVTGQTTTTAAGSTVTVPPLPSTPAALSAQTAITTAIDGRKIGFQKSSAELSDASRKVVADIADALKSNMAKIEVGGHTDWKGPATANQELSQTRADAVRKALIDAGIDGSRITAKGYGEDIPIASNETEAGRAENRRIEIRVIG